MRRELGIALAFAVSAALSGCAAGEVFGTSSAGDDSIQQESCSSGLDCFDNNPATEDICSADGTCLYFPVDLPDPEPPNQGDCSALVERTIDQNGVYQISLANNKGPADPTAPLSRGTVVRVDVREPTRLRSILGQTNTENEIVQVLLSDCANAAPNRISWGADLYTPALPAATYYLAIFSQGERTITLDVRYLIPSSCKDPVPAPIKGVISSTTDGYADDFSGSCAPPGEPGHRGDRVYRFEVPEGASWNLHAALTSYSTETPAWYIYLRQGCAGPAAREIACDAESISISNTGDISVASAELHLSSLPAGSYYLFVDSTDPEHYQLGDYALLIETNPVQPE